jgi:Zn-finger nucleic acid-binding protein
MSMKCPNDGTTLMMSERAGVQIDYCPECRGVWLERGALDRIIERGGSRDDRRGERDRHDDHHEHRHDGHHRHDDDHDHGYRDDRDDRDERHGRKRNRLSDIAGLFGGGED